MIDQNNRYLIPTLTDIYDYVQNDLLRLLCIKLQEDYKVRCQIDYSRCTFEPGWNVKWKKGNKTLCTLYLREGYFTILIVVGQKQKETVEKLLPFTSDVVMNIYHQTKEANQQKWLMIDLEDANQVYEDVLKLLQIRYNSFKSHK